MKAKRRSCSQKNKPNAPATSAAASEEAAAVAALSVQGGLPLWQHLFVGQPEWKRYVNHAALRLVCRETRALSYPLMTEVKSLQLGVSRAKKNPESSAAALEHLEKVQKFLERLPNLNYLKVKLASGGVAELVELIERGCASSSLQRMALEDSWWVGMLPLASSSDNMQ